MDSKAQVGAGDFGIHDTSPCMPKGDGILTEVAGLCPAPVFRDPRARDCAQLVVVLADWLEKRT